MLQKTLLALLLLPLWAVAAESWLLPFPDISFDSSRVYFTGERWTALYSAQTRGLAIQARDAIRNLPAPQHPANQVVLSSTIWRAVNNTLTLSPSGGTDSVRVLPNPTSDAIATLASGGGPLPNPASVAEVIGPLTTYGGRIWFGLTLGEQGRGTLDDRNPTRIVGGVGWYEPETNRFGRTYSPALFGFRPQWIGARRDSVYLLLTKPGSAQTKFMVYAAMSSDMVEVSLHRIGMPGSQLLSAVMWKDTLLLASNQAVAVWKPNRKPSVWESRAYQAPETEWIYLKAFPNGDPDASPPVEFLPFKSNLPLEVKAKMDGWLQVVSPITQEGYVDPDDWQQHGALWSRHAWNCGDKPCFARLRVKLHGNWVYADFTNTALTERGRSGDGVKVSFRAGWAREEDLVPVMLAP